MRWEVALLEMKDREKEQAPLPRSATAADCAAAVQSLTRAAKLCRAWLGIELSHIGLHPGQDGLLRELRDTPSTPGQLAASLQVRPPTISKMIERLESTGFVAREHDRTDHRRSSIRLTEKGEQALSAIDSAWERLASIAGRALSTDEIASTTSALSAIEDNLARALSRIR